MLQKANLYSIYCAHIEGNKDVLDSLLKFHDIKIKEAELKDLIKYLSTILSTKEAAYRAFDYFSFGFTIPQIGKEFDILRFGKKSIINIELKSEATIETIKEQLLKNKYYLKFLKLNLYLFTFISSENKFYKLDENDDIIEVNVLEVINLLNKQDINTSINLSTVFNPTDFLVSPFNSPNKFIDGEYFLTQEQGDVKRNIIKEIVKFKKKNIVVKGQPGSGKTLLIYDLAKHFTEIGSKTCIIHCANLNEGQITLIDDFDWNIFAIRNYLEALSNDFKIIIIDESQRIRRDQLYEIVEHAKKNDISIIYSYDEKQVLKASEKIINIPKIIETELIPKIFQLKGKIRTNSEITAFIKSLFEKNRIIEQYPYDSVELMYVNNDDQARSFMRSNIASEWKIINYTPSLYNTHKYENYHLTEVSVKTHNILGQEFDNVLVVIDKDFKYLDNTLSYSKHCFYNPALMLYQNITRARNKIKVIIIDNFEVLERCLQIVNVQKK